jgi:hypothetical protein
MCPALDAGFFIVRSQDRTMPQRNAEALWRDQGNRSLTTERLAIHAENRGPITVGRDVMVWIITSLLELSKTVDKQRQLN